MWSFLQADCSANAKMMSPIRSTMSGILVCKAKGIRHSISARKYYGCTNVVAFYLFW
jgi:hypothetical protein